MERLTGIGQDYAWGSPTLIPELLGQPAGSEPLAELWFGAHPKGPARLASGTTLAELVERSPDVVGRASVRQLGPRLPYLLKLLAAAAPLSLQAHPSRDQAEAGWRAESEAGLAADAPDRSYVDDWPKPEMVVALTEFDALCGFADPARTRRSLAALDVEGLSPLLELLRSGEPDVLRVAVQRLLGEDGWSAVVPSVVAAARARLAGTAPSPTGLDSDAPTDAHEQAVQTLCRTAVELAGHHPEDPGVVVALLLNRVRLSPGQALYLGAGNLHAYLGGLAVEVMASSDNVLRGGLTAKHVDAAELGAVLDATPAEPRLVPLVDEGEGRSRFDTPAPEFTLWRLDCADTPTTVPATPTGRVLLVTTGRVLLRTGGTALTLHRGEAAFLPAGDQVAVNGAGVAHLVAPGIR